jgi:type II secretory pathway pseudopilin PulG
MNVDEWQAPQSPGIGVRSRGEGGFSALEFLVIIVIVCVVVAIGVPTLHSRARSAVLDANMHTLASMVSSQVLEGYTTLYNPPTGGASDSYLSDHLTASLGSAGKAGFVNPCESASQGRAVVNSDSLPTGAEAKAPAVLITDCAEAQYTVFNALPASSRHLLAGSLVVEFNATAQTVDVFYVDAGGNKSPNVVAVPMA